MGSNSCSSTYQCQFPTFFPSARSATSHLKTQRKVAKISFVSFNDGLMGLRLRNAIGDERSHATLPTDRSGSRCGVQNSKNEPSKTYLASPSPTLAIFEASARRQRSFQGPFITQNTNPAMDRAHVNDRVWVTMTKSKGPKPGHEGLTIGEMPREQ